MTRTIGVGLALTVVLAVALRASFGPTALVPALIFGVLATAIQAGASRAMHGATRLSHVEFLKRYGIGMGLRLGGVLVLMVAIVAKRELFVPLPTALGFLGVLIPLLFLEARLAR